jgi:hypothetical protein
MASEKLPVKDILAAIDMGAKEVWDELSDEQKKQVSFWLLNRYVSSVKGKRDNQELAVFKTNEYYNKNWNVLGTKHPKLQWQLLCAAGNTGKIEYHEWIGLKSSKTEASKIVKFLAEIYPNEKMSDLEVLSTTMDKKKVKQLAKDHGWSDKQIDDLKL